MASNNPGVVSARPRFKASATLPTAVEDSHRCNESQHCDGMDPEGRSSKPQPKSPKIASSTGQHLETSASSQQLLMTGGENSLYALIADDTTPILSRIKMWLTSTHARHYSRIPATCGDPVTVCSANTGFPADEQPPHASHVVVCGVSTGAIRMLRISWLRSRFASLYTLAVFTAHLTLVSQLSSSIALS